MKDLAAVSAFFLVGPLCLLAGVFALQACAAGLSAEDQKTRDDYVLDEQKCVAFATSKQQGYDCICAVMARRGKQCAPLAGAGKDGG